MQILTSKKAFKCKCLKSTQMQMQMQMSDFLKHLNANANTFANAFEQIQMFSKRQQMMLMSTHPYCVFMI